jgi:hypothetical protein
VRLFIDAGYASFERFAAFTDAGFDAANAQRRAAMLGAAHPRYAVRCLAAWVRLSSGFEM